MADRIFGEIQGIPAGTTFQSRKEAASAGVHKPLQAGISGSKDDGADSIVISGGYEDDSDSGDVIIYTGEGGQNENGRQIANQELTRGNLALAKSEIDGLPVRVIRGADKKNPYAPENGYRYDGLYQVESHWHDVGKSGFLVYRFRLVKLDSELPPNKLSNGLIPLPSGSDAPKRTLVNSARIIRDSKLGRELKRLYKHKCQVCSIEITTNAGPYAEAAHIKPVGKPHNGPDRPENLLCLCPNHHLMLDKGVYMIGDDLSLIGIEGSLIKHPEHEISIEYIRYHRMLFN
ncbi:YDG/SRA domain-containing protein [Polynucleobacter sp. HIN5]|uniref:YDG/SRA domain-containing protein n=1 Tax=Polynucleobacter sp. HIN5 TaxID=3047864 RepID=UPI0025728817|nr:YDG/SRA domain-containing protein [Polynucleobacter sp. HIN5]BEI33728.1 HNH endonuclease [Polynucleobacter sp. HIN5]